MRRFSEQDAMQTMLSDAAELIRRLLRLIPGYKALDWSTVPAAVWRQDQWGGALIAHPDIDRISLDDLLCVADQKSALVQNTEQFLAGAPANNALLWGARGTGKSSLIHALLDEYFDRGLRLIEVGKASLGNLSDVALTVREEPHRFIVFCDDLSFEADDASYKALKSALEGSIFRSSENLLIYATSNRRHLLPEYMTDNEQASFVDGELHQSEAVEEKISLSDRFGLWLSFYPFKQDEYLEVVQHWIAVLAADSAVEVGWDEELRLESLRWALARGVRSGRTGAAWQRAALDRRGGDFRALMSAYCERQRSAIPVHQWDL